MYLHSIVSDIDDILPQAPFVRSGGSLLMMVGLPGTGKSSVVEGLQQFMSFRGCKHRQHSSAFAQPAHLHRRRNDAGV